MDGRPGRLEDERFGGWEVWRLGEGGWEDGRLGGWED